MSSKGLWESVYYSIVNSLPLTVTTYTYSPSERHNIDRILGAYLDAVGMKGMRTKLTYCIHELAANAKKANTKRLYFQEKSLDITNEGQYAEGMRTFKVDTISHIDYFLKKQKETGLYVKFQFRKLDRGVEVCIRNNAELTSWEKLRIEEKIEIARSYANLTDAYTRTEDGSEGAGLGIVMMLFMLKNLGFGTDSFVIASGSGETRATLTFMKPAAAAARMGASA